MLHRIFLFVLLIIGINVSGNDFYSQMQNERLIKQQREMLRTMNPSAAAQLDIEDTLETLGITLIGGTLCAITSCIAVIYYMKLESWQKEGNASRLIAIGTGLTSCLLFYIARKIEEKVKNLREKYISVFGESKKWSDD